MKNLKNRRIFQSSDAEDPFYKDYSSIPDDSGRNSNHSDQFDFSDRSENQDRIFMSVQRKDFSATKNAIVGSPAKPNDPFYNAQPKGMYFEQGSKVVDDYATRTDWRDRIRQAVAESESRVKPVSKEPAPWPDASGQINSVESADDDILWEIDEKYSSAPKSAPESVPISETKEERSAPDFGGKKIIRAEAYTAWLAERNEKIKGDEEQLIQTAAAKQKKLKRAEAHDFWRSERDARIAEEDAQLKADVAAKQKKQMQAEAHRHWLAARALRIAEEDAQLKADVAAKQKKQMQAEAHHHWLAARALRIAEEDAQLKADVAAKQKKQKQSEAHRHWLAARALRIAEEDAQLKADVAAKQKKQMQAEAHNNWLAARNERIAAEDAELLKKAALSKENTVSESSPVDNSSLSSDISNETDSGLVENTIVSESSEKPEDAENNIEDIVETETVDTVTVIADSKGEELKTEVEDDADEVDEAYENELRLLMGEKKNLEQLRVSNMKSAPLNPDDEFVV